MHAQSDCVNMSSLCMVPFRYIMIARTIVITLHMGGRGPGRFVVARFNPPEN